MGFHNTSYLIYISFLGSWGEKDDLFFNKILQTQGSKAVSYATGNSNGNGNIFRWTCAKIVSYAETGGHADKICGSTPSEPD